MRNIVFATNNTHKLREIRQLLGQVVKIVSLKEIGFDEEIPETGHTLKENALQKAQYIHDKYGIDCFADDTGLETDALNGAPGVYSARYAGEGCTYEDNVNKLLLEMRDAQVRTARFRTVIALILDGNTWFFEGSVEGEIIKEPKGVKGFGYDPVFQPAGYSLTFAGMPPELKNSISHRGKAVEKLTRFLKDYF